jgi:hypothetical protein
MKIKAGSYVLYGGEKNYVYEVTKDGSLGLENEDGVSANLIEPRLCKLIPKRKNIDRLARKCNPAVFIRALRGLTNTVAIPGTGYKYFWCCTAIQETYGKVTPGVFRNHQNANEQVLFHELFWNDYLFLEWSSCRQPCSYWWGPVKEGYTARIIALQLAACIVKDSKQHHENRRAK